MDQAKSSSPVAVWLIVGCVGALAYALFGNKPASVRVEPTPARAPVATSEAPAPKKSFAESLLEVPPSDRLVMAQDFAALGLRAPSLRRESYALSLALLESFPAVHPAAQQAATLRREVVARQNLPAADKRPVTDLELMTFAATVTATPSAGEPADVPPRRPTVAAREPVRELAAVDSPARSPTPEAPRNFSPPIFVPMPFVAGSPTLGPQQLPPLDPYGTISPVTGRAKTVQVSGGSDGTRPYVRSAPRR